MASASIAAAELLGHGRCGRREAVRPRWHDWVITLAILALAATGIWTLWGKDIVALFRPEEVRAEEPATAPPAPPAGNAQGPF
jgi:hypothetical protein